MKKTTLFIMILCIVLPNTMFAANNSFEYEFKVLIPNEYINMHYDGEYIFAQTADDRCAVFNRKFELICYMECDYSEKYTVSENLVVVKKDGFFGVINLSGEIQTPVVYDDISPFENGIAIATRREGNLTRLFSIDTKGNIIYDFTKEYNYIGSFVNGYAMARRNKIVKYYEVVDGKYGYMPGSIDVTEDNNITGLLFVDKYGKIIFEDLDADIVMRPVYGGMQGGDYIGDTPSFSPSLFNVHGVAMVKRSGKFGLIDNNGNILYDFVFTKYDSTSEQFIGMLPENGFVVFDISGTNHYKKDSNYISVKSDTIIVSEEDKFGLCSVSDGSVLLPIEYDKILGEYGYSKSHLQLVKDEKFGIFDVEKGMILPAEYDNIYREIILKNRKYGLISREGNFLTPLEYDELYYLTPFGYGFVKNGKHGFINKAGNIIIEAKYEDLSYVLHKQTYYLVASLNGKLGLLDMSGNQILPFEFELPPNDINKNNFNPYSDNKNLDAFKQFFFGSQEMIVCYKNGLCGIVDITGKLYIPFEYDSFQKVNSVDIFKAVKNGKSGILNHNGDIIVPFEYDPGDSPSYNSLDNYIIMNKNGRNVFYYIGEGELPKNVKYGNYETRIRLIGKSKKNNIRYFVICDSDLKSLKVVNENGVQVLPETYDFDQYKMDVFTQEINAKTAFTVKKKGKYGVVSIGGEIIFPFEFDSLDQITRRGTYIPYNIFKVSINGKIKLFNLAIGKIIDLPFEDVVKIEGLPINNGGSTVNILDFPYLLIETSNGCGVIDYEGNVIIPTNYLSIGAYDVQTSWMQASLVESTEKNRNYKTGIIDINENIILPFQYRMIVQVGENYFTAETIHGRGLIKLNGEIIIPFGKVTEPYSIYGFIKIISDNGKKQIYDFEKNIKYDCNGYSDTDISNYAQYLSGNQTIKAEKIVNSNIYATIAKMEVLYTGERKYFNANGELVLYTDKNSLYNDNNVVIGSSNLAPSMNVLDPNLDIYCIKSVINKSCGVVVINKIPKPQNEISKNFICFALNNPIANFNGEIRLLEKYNYFTTPIMEKNSILVPCRSLFEAFGLEIAWDDKTKTLTATKGNLEVSLQIKNNEMTVNGKKITLDIPPKIINSRTFVPVRVICESLNATVDWDDVNKQAIIIAE